MNIIENKKITSNADLRKQAFLSEEKIMDRSQFVNKNLSQS